MKCSIIIFASEISVICDLNKYENIEDTFMKVWRRCFPSQVKKLECLLEHDALTKKEEIEKLIEKLDISGDISNFVEKSINVASIENINTALTNLTDISSAVVQHLDKKKQEQVIKTLQSKIQCGFGAKQEASALNSYEKESATIIANRNEQFYKRILFETDKYDVIIGGKVDGIKDDGTVIEVKNRMRRFFDPLPKYDIAQLQTYLFILDARQGELIEQLKGKSSIRKSTIIDRDNEYWENIIKCKIVQFCTALYEFVTNKSLQTQFIISESEERKAIINGLLQ